MPIPFLPMLLAFAPVLEVPPVTDSATYEIPAATQIVEVETGSGDEAMPGRDVRVHYTGWLLTDGKRGTKFDSSRDRGDPFVFPLGGGKVIRGWDLGVQGMKVGGKRTLIIPASDGYGARGAGGVIPPGAALIFDVELLGVE